MIYLNLELLKFILSVTAILAGIAVITSKNAVISVFNLICLYLLVAFYLMLIGITFIGISYIIIYVGAIAILFLFIIMMIDIEVVPSNSRGRKTTPLIFFLFLLFIGIFNQFVYYLGFIRVKNFSFYNIQKINNLDDHVSMPNSYLSLFEKESNLEKDLNIVKDFFDSLILNMSGKYKCNLDNFNLGFKNSVIKNNSIHSLNNQSFDSDLIQNINSNDKVYKDILETSYDSLNFLYNSVIIPTWESMLGNITQIAAIGDILYSTYSSFLFILSILLLLGMVGAIILTAKDNREIKVVTIFKSKNSVPVQNSTNLKKLQLSSQVIGFSYLDENPILSEYHYYFDLFQKYFSMIYLHKDIIIWILLGCITILILFFFVISYFTIKQRTISTIARCDYYNTNYDNETSSYYSDFNSVPEDSGPGGGDPDNNSGNSNSGTGNSSNGNGNYPNRGSGNGNSGSRGSINGTGNSSNGTGNSSNGTGNSGSGGSTNGTGNISNGTGNSVNGGGPDNLPGQGSSHMTESGLRNEWEGALRRAQELRPDLPRDTEGSLNRLWDNFERSVPRNTTPENIRLRHMSRMLDRFRDMYGVNGNGSNGGTGGNGPSRGLTYLPFFFDFNSDIVSAFQAYIFILYTFALISLIICILLLSINYTFSLDNAYVGKGGGFECGFTGFFQTRERFNVVFYRVGILFLMFDLEIFVVLPFAVGILRLQLIRLWSSLFFLGVLMLGLAYELKKKGIDFEKSIKSIELRLQQLDI